MAYGKNVVEVVSLDVTNGSISATIFAAAHLLLTLIPPLVLWCLVKELRSTY